VGIAKRLELGEWAEYTEALDSSPDAWFLARLQQSGSALINQEPQSDRVAV